MFFFFFQAEDGIRDIGVTGVQTCALPIFIVQEVMPGYADKGSVGIITPYKLQAEEINKALGQDIASTVHKYQGRECDTIILSTVDNLPTDFSDDANLRSEEHTSELQSRQYIVCRLLLEI